MVIACVVSQFTFVVEKFKSNPVMVGFFAFIPEVILPLPVTSCHSEDGCLIGSISILLTFVQFDWLLKIRDNDDN